MSMAHKDAGTSLRGCIRAADHERSIRTGRPPAAAVHSAEDAPTPIATTAIEPRLCLKQVQGGKPVVRWFCSYAHRDGNNAKALRAMLELRLRNSRHYGFNGWSDQELLPGDIWFDQITRALQEAHLGVALVSNAFLSSAFITKHELPAFVGKDGQGVIGRRIVPALLEPVDFATADMHGLETRQIYFDGDGKAFAERSRARQVEWVDGLVRRIHALVQRYADNDGGAP